LARVPPLPEGERGSSVAVVDVLPVPTVTVQAVEAKADLVTLKAPSLAAVLRWTPFIVIDVLRWCLFSDGTVRAHRRRGRDGGRPPAIAPCEAPCERTCRAPVRPLTCHADGAMPRTIPGARAKVRVGGRPSLSCLCDLSGMVSGGSADMAESATTDDRVKDRLGGWQDSETRKYIYQDRKTDDLRAQAATVRRQLRLGVGLPVPTAPTSSPTGENSSAALDLDAVLAALTPEQRVLSAARLDGTLGGAPTTRVGPSVGPGVGPGVGPKAKSPGPTRGPAIGNAGLTRTSRERATGLEPATSSLGSWHSTN
jgi:hypothetical protein